MIDRKIQQGGSLRYGVMKAERDPYKILEVSPDASATEIKRAFRRLAKLYHPDQASAPDARQRFAQIKHAYELLSDDKKRRQFDRGEIDAEGKQRFRGYENFSYEPEMPESFARRPHSSNNFEDILNEILGGVGGRQRREEWVGPNPNARKGKDISLQIAVSLEEWVRTGKTRLRLPTGREFELSLPFDLEDGTTLLLKGQGYPGINGGAAGDVQVTVSIRPDPLFLRDGSDLRLTLPVTLYEAVLGARIKIPTLEGSVFVTVPPHSNAGKVLRLKGRGLPKAKDLRGDLLLTLQIILPQEASPDLEALMRLWEERHRYSVRGHAFE